MRFGGVLFSKMLYPTRIRAKFFPALTLGNKKLPTVLALAVAIILLTT